MTESNKKASQILSYLYLGSKNDAKDETWLKSTGIKYILNCTPPRTVDPVAGTPNYFQKDKSFHYKRVPVFDNQGEDILSHLDTAYKFIEEGKHYGSVLVHCHKGVSRSASFVIGYLMKQNEFTRDEAIDYVKTIRPIIQPNETFLTQLLTYESKLNYIMNTKETSLNSHHSLRNSIESIGPSLGPSTIESSIEEIDNVIETRIENPDSTVLGKRSRTNKNDDDDEEIDETIR